jgi:hypothetical protein
VVFERDKHCPPTVALVPKEGYDLFVAGPPPVVTAWLIQRYHWDDEEGNDLTVDVFCMTAGNYFSFGVTQSRGTGDAVTVTTLMWPGGKAPNGADVLDPGHC